MSAGHAVARGVMVARLTLDQLVLVRIQAGQRGSDQRVRSASRRRYVVSGTRLGTRLTSRPEEPIQAVRGVVLQLRQDTRVDVGSDGDPRMTEQLRDDLQILPAGHPPSDQRGGGGSTRPVTSTYAVTAERVKLFPPG
jgi:hypothetical protein